MSAGLTDRRIAAIAGGAAPDEAEVRELARLAQMGRKAEAGLEGVVLSQGISGGLAGVSHTWRVDVGFDEEPAAAQLLGKRVRVVPVEQVLRGYKKGEGWPKDPTTMGLMPGVRPPRNWRSPVDQ